MKIAVTNNLSLTVNDVELDLDYEENILRLDRHEPNFQVKNGKIQFGNLDPKTSKTVAIYFDPMICAKQGTNINCRVSYKDAYGLPKTLQMETKKEKVVCPIFKTASDINIGLLKELVQDLEWKDSKIYQIPPERSADKLLQICKETIQMHDVKHIRTLYTKDNQVYETWYYGKTKVGASNVVIKASINLETSKRHSRLELFAATPNPESLTGLLAELGHTFSEKLSSESITKKPVQQIINIKIKESVIQRSNLLSYCDINGTCIGDVVIEGNVINRSQILSNKCPNCKNEITPDMKFCSECGYKLK
ncbi:MAG: zinc ribbon domain-containing protein [Methanosarcinales archaeon]